MSKYMMLYTSFSSWITQLLACMGSCFGCCNKSRPISLADEPTKGLRIQGQPGHKPSLSEDFWSSSTFDLDYTTFPSQRSYSSISVPNQILNQISGPGSSSNHPDFVNHGLLLWNQSRLRWVETSSSSVPREVQEPVLSWNSSYENLLGTSKRFPQPVPLSEMVEFLGDIWEQEGLL